jgi:hypothetical protein
MEKCFQLPSSSQNRETYSSLYVTYFMVVLCYLYIAVLCLQLFIHLVPLILFVNHAQVKLIKCLVDNIVVDISFNQVGGLCTLSFLEQVCLLFKSTECLLYANDLLE